jgi:hypothetical protein
MISTCQYPHHVRELVLMIGMLVKMKKINQLNSNILILVKAIAKISLNKLSEYFKKANKTLIPSSK